MRAVRFAAVLEFSLDPDTERGIVPALPSLAKVSKERVSEELRKILASRVPSRALAIAERTGIMGLILPELSSAWDAWAPSLGGRAAAVARWLARIDAAPPEARLAALIADLAPPDGSASRLDRDAVKRAQDVLRRLKFSNEELAAASVVAGTGSACLVPAWTDGDIRRLLVDVTRAHAPTAVAVWRTSSSALADRAAAILAAGDPLATGDLAISGKDLIDVLAMPPGPSIGRLLVALLNKTLDDPSLNTRERLLEEAQKLELLIGRDHP
jgi:tRNA nucleotidyltransferase (CCA-adding enzyme)